MMPCCETAALYLLTWFRNGPSDADGQMIPQNHYHSVRNRLGDNDPRILLD
jgi:hypothetical protein